MIGLRIDNAPAEQYAYWRSRQTSMRWLFDVLCAYWGLPVRSLAAAEFYHRMLAAEIERQ